MPDAHSSDANKETLVGRKKAAAFLLSLDSETAAALMQRLSERDVALLSEEMTRMGDITGKDMEGTLEDFTQSIGLDRVAIAPMVTAILEKALGKERAREMLDKISKQTRDAEPFRALLTLDAKQVATLLRGEHPQVLAIVIAYLEPLVASELLKSFPEDLRYEVVKRISSTQEISAELVRQVDEMLEVRAFALGSRKSDSAGDTRFKRVAQMLNVSEPSMSKSLMDRLNREAPEIANEIQALMFVFADLLKIADKDMQKVLSEIDKADLALGLKAAPPELVNKVLGNLSARARDNIKEEIDGMGPRPLSDVEEAQKRILTQVRQMIDKGDIRIERGGSEVMV
jgi:flagellar motor switch protein FliG